jgi:plasmid stabilization system protein ParE
MGKYKLRNYRIKTYAIRILPTAQKDMAEIVDYLNTLSSQAAFSYYDLITQQISSLSHMPQRYVLLKDAQLRLRAYRCLPVKSYLVFYVIAENNVQIRRILFGRCQYEGLL